MGKIGQARGFLFFRIVNKFFSASEKKTKTDRFRHEILRFPLQC